MENIKYQVRVLRDDESYVRAGKTVNKRSVRAVGQVLCLPKAAFVDDAVWQQIFRRWLSSTANCEVSSPQRAYYQNEETIYRISIIDDTRVCATLIGGSLDVNDDYVTLTTNIVPYGPKGDALAAYMDNHEELTIVPRFILDSDGKISGVPAWDLDLPSDWEIPQTISEQPNNAEIEPHERKSFRIATYNSVSDPCFFVDIQKVAALCLQKDVGWSLHYMNSNDSWYFRISSAAESETFTGKDRSLQIAVAAVLEHLTGIGN